jgi:hypothetical protein
MMQVCGLLCEPLPRRLQEGTLLMQSRDFDIAHAQRRRSVSLEGPAFGQPAQDGKLQVT